MGIESNKEAMAMMKNTLGSIENRFREAYNKGYKDGLRDGASQVTAKLVSKMLEEIDADTPHACKTCPYHEQCSAEDWRTCHWDYVSKRYIEPQTDDLIKQADALIAFEKEWLEMDEPQTERSRE